MVACINDLNEQDKQRIEQAVLTSDTCLFLVHDEQSQQSVQYH